MGVPSKVNLQEKYKAALLAQGCKIVESQSRRYVVLTRPAGGFYYLGKSGAVRWGTTIAGSMACSDKIKKAILHAV